MKYKKYCIVCGQLIPKKSERWGRYLKKKYCSNYCQTRTFVKDKIVSKCIICRKEFEYKQGQQTGKFCSQECFNKYQDKRIKLYCEWCNKEIEVKQCYIKKHKYHFCSPECQIKWQQSQKIKKQCVVCGKEFYCSKSQKNRKTCSDHCKGVLTCIKQANKKDLNRLELTGREILQELGLQKDKDFNEQYLLENKFLVDVYSPNRKIVIQWDGDYWHNLFKRKKLDEIQDRYLQKAGYRVLRFWESEVYNNSDKVKEKIYEAIQS